MIREAIDKVKVLVKDNDVINAESTTLYKLLDYDPTSASTAEGYVYYPFQTKENFVWNSLEPELTVPDQADTVEQMLARIANGTEVGGGSIMMRSLRDYPSDPSQARETRALLDDLKKTAEVQLQQTQQQILADRQKRIQAQKAAEKEAEQYEAFKRWQQSKSKEGVG